MVLKKDDNIKINNDTNNILLDIKSLDPPVETKSVPALVASRLLFHLLYPNAFSKSFTATYGTIATEKASNISFSNTDQAIGVDRKIESILLQKILND